MSTPSLYGLPVELLHRIIDYVDTETIFFSFRNVCKHFYTIINSYNQYKLDFRSITKPAFHRIRHFIQPENVISLIISDGHKTPGQVGLFLSLFDISTFTQLRSFTLIQIDKSDWPVYLQHISKCPVVSLSIDIRKNWLTITTPETIELLKHCPIRHLTLTQRISPKQISDLFLYFPYLKTLMLDGIIIPNMGDNLTAPLKTKSKLKSLTIDFYSSSLSTIISVLSCTPSLIHLKLIGHPMASGLAWDGYWLAEFIQNNLPQLQYFEFFFDRRIDYNESTYDIESMMTSFRTSFWLEKRWYVACDYYKDTHELKLYSIPICKPTILYRSTPNKISCSNLINDTPYIMDNVCSLIMNSIPATADTCDKSDRICRSLNGKLSETQRSLGYKLNLLTNHPLFPRVTELTLFIHNDFSNGSIDYLSSCVDFSHLETLSLTLDLSKESFKNIRTIINRLLDRTCNVQSINLRSTRSKKIVEHLKIICPMISNQMKHLIVHLEDSRDMQWIVDQFENVSSIKFAVKNNVSLGCDEIVTELSRKGRDFSYCKEFFEYASFWFGERKLNN